MDRINAYKRNAVNTRSPGHLIVMLYDGAVRSLGKAVEEIEAQRYIEKGQYINKAIDIINELDISLDMDGGDDIAQNLRTMYDFMRRHLTTANLKADPQMIREVIKLLEDLNEGWRAVAG